MEHDNDTARSEGGSTRTRALLLILLLLAGAGAYLYLFTDLIRPQASTEQASPVVEQVKQPMPQKAETAPAVVAVPGVAATPAAVSPQVPPPAAVPGPAKQPTVAQTPATQPAPSTVAKVPTPPPPPAQAKGATTPAPQKQGTAPQAPAKADQKIAAPAAVPAKTAALPPTPPKATETQKPKAAEAEKPKAAEAQKPRPATVKGAFQVVAGEYPGAPQLQEAMAKVKRAGFKPATEKGTPRPTTMHRLLVGEYGDRAGADASLQRVKTAGGQGFALREGDHFAVYAGSFAADSKAAQEKASLAAKGITTTMRTATVPMPVTRLTAGRFATREEAKRAADKLAKAGFKPTVSAR